MSSSLSKKKPQVYGPDKFEHIFQVNCSRAVLARLGYDSFNFNGVFLDADSQGFVLDNRLMHLDDVRRLKNKELQLYFPYRKTLLKGTVRLVGLTTFKGIRALRFTMPEMLVTDEKRGVKRVSYLPQESEITFHSPELHIFHGRIHDASPSGFALILPESTPKGDAYLKKGGRFMADATLDKSLKLSFNIEIRHLQVLPKSGSTPGSFKVGVKIIKLTQEAQARLNNWLLECNMREQQMEAIEDGQVPKKPEVAPVNISNSILVVGPESIDLDFWYQCLGRKFEVITSDDNIANIRDALNTGPSLVIFYLDANNAEKASFTRKFCSSLNNRYPLMFFGKESDTRRQATLMGQIQNLGFLDINERKILLKFRQVDEVMKTLNKP